MDSQFIPIRKCDRCPALVKCRSRIVNGAGVNNAPIAFVGSGPQEQDDKDGRPWQGRDGKVLRILQWAAGIDTFKSYHTNATRCFVRRAPSSKEVDNCHDYLMDELRTLNPRVIVAMGGHALRTLYKPGITVGSVMGFTLYNDELPGIPIIPTYHPAYLRTNWKDTTVVLAHLRKAKHIAYAGGLNEEFGSYMGIETLEQLRSLRDYLLGPDIKLISVDTETTGLSWMDSELLCVSFTPEEGIGYSVPLMHRGERQVPVPSRAKKAPANPRMRTQYFPTPYWDLDTEMPEVLDIIQQILGSDIPKAGQNFGFDINMLERDPSWEVVTAATAFGFDIKNFQHDSRSLASLVSESLPANLTLLAALYTDIPYYEADIIAYKSKMWELDDNKLWIYGGADVDVVQTLVPPLLARVKQEGTDWVYENISIPLVRCATMLERRGVRVDVAYFDKLCKHYKHELEEAYDLLETTLGRHLDHPSHWETVQNLLFKELKLPLTASTVPKAGKECRKCKRDAPCSPGHAGTGAGALEALALTSPHPVLPVLINIRHLEKFSGTYLEGGKSGGYRAHIRSDNRIHPRWSSGRAATGRFGCDAPNLMNPPKEVEIDCARCDLHSKDAIREMFIAREGYGVLNADWSQMEVWVMAYETNDETLLGLLRAGIDVHAYVSRELCKLGISAKFPSEAVDEHLTLDEWKVIHSSIRDDGKVFVFGMNYGLTDEGAGQRLGCTKEEAAPLLAHYVQFIFPGMEAFFLRIREEIYENSSVSNIFGRRRHFDEVPLLAALHYRGDLEGAVRQGFNLPIQGGAHDLHSLAHIQQERLPSLAIAPPVLEMHDSLMLEGPQGALEDIAHVIQEEWQKVARDTILANGEPLNWDIPVEVKWGPSFGTLDHVLTGGGEVSKI